MRRAFWLLVLTGLTGCAGPASDPVEVAERFHALRTEGDDRGIHALLTEADRTAVPLDAFPADLPPRVALELFGWGDAPVDSASLLTTAGDTAAVVLHVGGGARDTVRLVATHDPRDLLLLELDRVRWRVSMRLAERTLVDSLAADMRAASDATVGTALERAEEYLRAAERYPALAHPADVDAAGSLLRAAAVAEALRIELRMSESIDGVPFLQGQIENPTERSVTTLRLIVRDAAGEEEEVELWDVSPGGSTAVWQLTRLREGPLTHRVDHIKVF